MERKHVGVDGGNDREIKLSAMKDGKKEIIIVWKNMYK
jgi:hypothetical protein